MSVTYSLDVDTDVIDDAGAECANKDEYTLADTRTFSGPLGDSHEAIYIRGTGNPAYPVTERVGVYPQKGNTVSISFKMVTWARELDATIGLDNREQVEVVLAIKGGIILQQVPVAELRALVGNAISWALTTNLGAKESGNVRSAMFRAISGFNVADTPSL
jgi:hypothetical protein